MAFEPQSQAQRDAITSANSPTNSFTGAAFSNLGLTGAREIVRSTATAQDSKNAKTMADWRVKLSLAKGADYLYLAPKSPGILSPLRETGGVIFPYTPSIAVTYAANYNPTDLTHSNYKFFSYQGSSIDQITIGCEFTAQDTREANYLLAVIHFFKSVTKMFYGQDSSPRSGTPPPLCYLTGYGAFQFDNHPLAISNFSYTLPTDVNYIRAGNTDSAPGVNTSSSQSKLESVMDASWARRDAGGLLAGGRAAPPKFSSEISGTDNPTYVPTKILINITAVPITTRNDVSNNFSLAEYAKGTLLRGSKRAGGGIW